MKQSKLVCVRDVALTIGSVGMGLRAKMRRTARRITVFAAASLKSTFTRDR